MSSEAHTGQHIEEGICEKCLDYRLSHSIMAGQNSALKQAIQLVEDRAARLWLEHKDSEALLLRSVAGNLTTEQRKTSAMLQKFINGDPDARSYV